MKQKQKRVPQQRRAPTAPITSAAALTFRHNIIAEDNGKAFFLQAGKPSPWHRLEDVPAKLQGLVAEPENTIAQDNEMQMVVSRERLRQEDEVLERLNSGGDLDPAVRAALDERGKEHLATVRARNLALEEAAARNDIDHDQLIAEHEAESLAIYEERKIL